MTQEEAFLQAICESPADDVPRLVYADWLEEQGGPERADRAQFIRVQVERARLPAAEPRQAALRKEEGRLAEGYAYGWHAQLPRLPGVTWGRFWRGFLAAAAVERWPDFRRQAAALFAATPVQFLSLPGVNEERCRRLARSRYLSRLLSLTLRGTVGDAGAQALAACPRLAGLRTLDLAAAGPVGEAGALALAASPHLSGLTLLRLPGNGLGGEATAALRQRFGPRLRLVP